MKNKKQISDEMTALAHASWEKRRKNKSKKQISLDAKRAVLHSHLKRGLISKREFNEKLSTLEK